VAFFIFSGCSLPSERAAFLSAVDKNSGRTAIHIHREKQHARQNVCIAFSCYVFNVVGGFQTAWMPPPPPRTDMAQGNRPVFASSLLSFVLYWFSSCCASESTPPMAYQENIPSRFIAQITPYHSY